MQIGNSIRKIIEQKSAKVSNTMTLSVEAKVDRLYLTKFFSFAMPKGGIWFVLQALNLRLGGKHMSKDVHDSQSAEVVKQDRFHACHSHSGQVSLLRS